jgi:hypothetical protein
VSARLSKQREKQRGRCGVEQHKGGWVNAWRKFGVSGWSWILEALARVGVGERGTATSRDKRCARGPGCTYLTYGSCLRSNARCQLLFSSPAGSKQPSARAGRPYEDLEGATLVSPERSAGRLPCTRCDWLPDPESPKSPDALGVYGAAGTRLLGRAIAAGWGACCLGTWWPLCCVPSLAHTCGLLGCWAGHDLGRP